MGKIRFRDVAKLSAGALLVNSQIKNGNLTGRERVYHNTDRENVESIKRNGILSAKALDPNNLTHSASGDFLTDEDMAGLTYVARKRSPALGVAIATGNRKINNPESEYYKDPLGAYLSRKTVKADIPSWKMEMVDNPELGGAKNQHELKKVLSNRWRQRADKKYGNSIANKIIISPALSISANLSGSSIYDQLGPKGTYTVKGDINPEYIVGSDKYKLPDKEELSAYINANKNRFAAGAGLSLAGVALAGNGIANMAKPLIKKADDYKYEIEKSASLPANIAIGALGTGLVLGSNNALIGKKTLYQGTSQEAWDKIKSEGIKAQYGGSGASKAVGNSAYQKNSQGKIHLTAVRPIANVYASANTPEIKAKKEELQALKDRALNIQVQQGAPGKSVVEYKLRRGHHRDKVERVKQMENELKEMNMREASNLVNTLVSPSIRTEGKTVKVKMSYNDWKNNMEQDREGVMYKRHVNKLKGDNNPIIKNMAARGSIDVPIEEIVGSDAPLSDRIGHTAKMLPGYIKENPVRFSAGALGTAVGAKLVGDSIKGVVKR